MSPELLHSEQQIIEKCNLCGVCQKHCPFLQQYGLPKTIAANHCSVAALVAFECSLCGLCAAVCPEKLFPEKLFLAMRRQAVEAGVVDFSPYRRVLRYEQWGRSALFSYYGLPDGGDTVFFPGCTLPGTRPKTTLALFEHLRKSIPSLGIVFDCCSKISHDLGRKVYFTEAFSKTCARLKKHGVRNLLTACPNCHVVFRQYGTDFNVQTIYEYLNQACPPPGDAIKGTVTIHDPCPLRRDDAVQTAVRTLVARIGLTLQEMPHSRCKTICCGEGGSVGFLRSDLSRNWTFLRKQEVAGLLVVTYCAGCAGYLKGMTPAVHIADLLMNPEKKLNDSIQVARAPWTYLNRLGLKRILKKRFG